MDRIVRTLMGNAVRAIIFMSRLFCLCVIVLAFVMAVVLKVTPVLWCIGVLMLFGSCFVIAANYYAFIMSALTKRFHSQVPLIGGPLGVAGLLVVPIKMPHPLIYALPMILDIGTLMFFAWVVEATSGKLTTLYNAIKLHRIKRVSKYHHIRCRQLIVICIAMYLFLSGIFHACGISDEGAWAMGTIFLSLFSMLFFYNLFYLFEWLRKRRIPSVVPMCGGLMGLIGVAFLPPIYSRLFFWLPIVLDMSVWGIILALHGLSVDKPFAGHHLRMKAGVIFIFCTNEAWQKIPVSDISRLVWCGLVCLILVTLHRFGIIYLTAAVIIVFILLYIVGKGLRGKHE